MGKRLEVFDLEVFDLDNCKQKPKLDLPVVRVAAHGANL